MKYGKIEKLLSCMEPSTAGKEFLEAMFTRPSSDKTYEGAWPEELNWITSIRDYGFAYIDGVTLTSLPEGLVSIGTNAFWNARLALTSLPSGLKTISRYAFRNCSGLKTLTFKGKPASIDSLVFYGCSNLTTINVPWAEGEVAFAPWGATNATINYNYVETEET